MRISDWSSDVCSSDLQPLIHVHVNDLRAIFNLLPGDLDSGMVIASKDQLLELGGAGDVGAFTNVDENGGCLLGHCSFLPPLPLTRRRRSEERRVGKECVSTCRSRWSPYHSKKKINLYQYI